MNDKKLKPEHRKLWRRIYLDSFEGDGTSPEEAERMADKVVAQWDARGAFDDVATPLTFVKPYAVMLPDDPHVTRSRLIKHSLQFDIAVALTRPHDGDGVMLVAMTERGERLARKASETNLETMFAFASEIS